MTSNEYKASSEIAFGAACDKLGLDLAIATQMASLLNRIERRGYPEGEAMRLIVEGLKDATLSRQIASDNVQESLKKDLDRIESLESTLEEIGSIAKSA